MISNIPEQNFVTVSPDGTLSFHIANIQEAKLAIKQLKIKKKEISLAKKQIIVNQRMIRAEYTDSTRRQGSMMRGGKGFGSFVRSIQRTQRSVAKIELANKLAPLEKEIYQYESILSAIDQGILKLETYILENSNGQI